MDLITTDTSAFKRAIGSLEMWGGSRSVADVGPFSATYDPRSAAYRDTVRFREALIAVAELMKKHWFRNGGKCLLCVDIQILERPVSS